MKPEDVMVWERFIQARPDFFSTVDYDFRVGEGAPQAPTLPENIARDGKILTQKKVDVIGYKDNDIYIIELKPTADTRALGQILAYYNLYIKDNPNARNVHKMVIAGEIERELEDVYFENDVIVELV